MLRKFLDDARVIFPLVRENAPLAVFNAFFGIRERPAATLPNQIQRAITKQTIEILRRVGFVTWKILALRVAEKTVIFLGVFHLESL
jgi:hypothetical protein